MFFLFALFSEEPDLFLLKYSQTAILNAAHFLSVVKHDTALPPISPSYIGLVYSPGGFHHVGFYSGILGYNFKVMDHNCDIYPFILMTKTSVSSDRATRPRKKT